MKGPALWAVQRSSSTVFLFGETVGVGLGEDWFTEPIRAALDGSREFWCEVGDPQELASSPLLAEYGLSDRPLSHRLDDSQLRWTREIAHLLGIDPTTLESLRPWLAGQLLEGAHRSQTGVDATVDVHQVLLSRATAAHKVIRTELPDARATLSFFAGLGDAVEIEYLMWTLDRVAGRGEEIPRQVAAWRRGDGSVVERQVAAMRRKYPSLHQVLLADRNRAWVPRIEAMLQRPGSCFVLVGDSHLPGDDGIPALLTGRGLRLRRAA